MQPRSLSFIYLFKNLDLNLKHLNPESRVYVCVCATCTVSVQTHTWAITVWLLLHWPLSPILQVHWLVPARPKITHIDLPRRRVYSPAITAVPQNHRRPFFSFFFSYRATTYVKYLQQCCASMNGCFYVPFLHQGKKTKQNKKDEKFTSWQFDGYCFFLSPSARANKSNQCSLWADLSIM